MTVSFAKRVSTPADVLMQELDGESVLLNLQSETYFGLDAVGTRMWQVLVASESIQVAYEALLSEYEVEADQLRGDLQDLLRQLMEHGLVELHGN